MTLSEFETLVLTQQPATAPWTPVTDYSEAARKAAEGPHAQLIMDVLKPKNALDVGCGFNYLAKWVNRRAGHSLMFGADKDNPAADYPFDITDDPRRMRLSFDLVVCREVLEHLTVRQIHTAVRHLCALSSRLTYVTTRFSTAPGLLDVQTHDELDPTHISLLPMDLLRSWFVLEGFRRRPDLETAMDWKHLGRVLVYERA